MAVSNSFFVFCLKNRNERKRQKTKGIIVDYLSFLSKQSHIGGINMGSKIFEKYLAYLTIMINIKKLYDDGFIDESDYSKLESMYALKYGIPDDSLFRYK